MPPRALASGPKPCGGNYSYINIHKLYCLSIWTLQLGFKSIMEIDFTEKVCHLVHVVDDYYLHVPVAV